MGQKESPLKLMYLACMSNHDSEKLYSLVLRLNHINHGTCENLNDFMSQILRLSWKALGHIVLCRQRFTLNVLFVVRTTLKIVAMITIEVSLDALQNLNLNYYQ